MEAEQLGRGGGRGGGREKVSEVWNLHALTKHRKTGPSDSGVMVSNFQTDSLKYHEIGNVEKMLVSPGAWQPWPAVWPGRTLLRAATSA